MHEDYSNGWRSDPQKWKSNLLLSAIRDQQLSSVQLLVKAGADFNYRNAVCVAACRKDPRYVRCLLENGAHPNAYNDSGHTALHEAVLDGFVETMSALVEAGADVNQQVVGSHIRRDEKDATPLMQACGYSQCELIMQVITLATFERSGPTAAGCLW